MYHLIKFGSQLLKKFDQIIKRAKWSKLGFWLRRSISDFWPRKWPIGLNHDSNGSIASSWPNNMVQKITSSLDWQMNFSVNWLKVNCTLKSQTLTFWSKSSAKGHNSSKHIKIWNLFINKSRIQDFILKRWICKLRNFSKC